MRGPEILTKHAAEKLVQSACAAMATELARLRAENTVLRDTLVKANELHEKTITGSAENERAWTAELARLRAELEQNKAATERALELAVQYGGIDGDHHKAWVIDQMVRALLVTEPVYAQFVKDACDGEDGPDTYAWDTGVIP